MLLEHSVEIEECQQGRGGEEMVNESGAHTIQARQVHVELLVKVASSTAMSGLGSLSMYASGVQPVTSASDGGTPPSLRQY